MIAYCSTVLTLTPREVFLVGSEPVSENVRLLREIAAGPRSSVYVGDLNGQVPGAERDLVAVKVFRQRTPRDAETLFRLREVGRDLAALNHPVLSPPMAVIRVNDQLGLISEYVDGIDLADLCEVLWQTETTVHTRVICGVLAAVAEALDAALHRVPQGREHPLARSHRDLRPSNIMLDRFGGVRVLDLGVGLTSLSGRAARADALKMGLTRYMSPERREGKRGSATSDVYALGIIGVELARSGWLKRTRVRNPDHDRHLAEVVARIADHGFRTEGDELMWRNLLLRMVAHDPDARPNAAEVASTCRALQDAATGADLQGFSVSHIAQWLEAVPTEPDSDLVATSATVLASPAEAPPGPTLDEELDTDEAEFAEEEDWVETPDGWQHASPDSEESPVPSNLAVVLAALDALPPVTEEILFGDPDADDTVFGEPAPTDWGSGPPAGDLATLDTLDELPPSSTRALTPLVLAVVAFAAAAGALVALFVAWWWLG